MRPLAFAAAIAGVALALLAVLLFALPGKIEVKPELALAKSELASLEQQEAHISLTANRETSVTVILEVRDSKGRVATARHQTLTIDKDKEGRVTFAFAAPKQTGTYDAKLTARWNRQQAVVTQSFQVREALLEPLLPTVPVVPPEGVLPPEEGIPLPEVPQENITPITPTTPPTEVPIPGVDVALEQELRNMSNRPTPELVAHCEDKPKEQLAGCLELVAIVKDDLTVCDRIEFVAKHDSCYSWFILGKEKWDLCPKLVEPGLRNACQLAGIALTAKSGEGGGSP